jgi:hypothetical protein
MTYQLFHERDERLQILFEREMELIAVFEVDRDFRVLVEYTPCEEGYVLCKISPRFSMVSRLPHLTSPPSYPWPPSQPQNSRPSTY